MSLKTDMEFQFRLYTKNILPSKYNIIITKCNKCSLKLNETDTFTDFCSEMHALCPCCKCYVVCCVEISA